MVISILNLQNMLILPLDFNLQNLLILRMLGIIVQTKSAKRYLLESDIRNAQGDDSIHALRENNNSVRGGKLDDTLNQTRIWPT